MNEITKFRVLRFLRMLGVERLRRPQFIRTTYCRKNFPNVSHSPTIFDIGANIGQSTIEFEHSFKDSVIYAFEPVTSVYQSLIANTKKYSNVRSFNLGMGEVKKSVRTPKCTSSIIQTTQILGNFDLSDSDTEEVNVTAVDDFSRTQRIPTIDILKTDTEGFDLDVCRGMSQMLRSKNVRYIISEVSIAPNDKQHTNLDELRAFLLTFDYELVSLFDLEYEYYGHLSYFNALFTFKQV